VADNLNHELKANWTRLAQSEQAADQQATAIKQ
jgi:hypothetical protein